MNVVPAHTPDPLAELARAVRVLKGRGLAELERHRFSRYLALLTTWNKAQRLTGIRSPEGIVRSLFRDSLLFLQELPEGASLVADIGAGAGIPGVPIAIFRPEVSVTLIEAKRKKVSFLLTLVRDLELANVRVLEGRAETLIVARPELAESLDCVVSRAVRLTGPIFTAVMRYLRPGGRVVISGSAQSDPTGIPGVERITRVSPELGLTRVFLSIAKPLT